ncbi:MAG: hypothetical protein GJ676_06415 [Rhodobacteraceae bacterium]|nr:hypothetical protein [Paracoccaceae bacterium]
MGRKESLALAEDLQVKGGNKKGAANPQRLGILLSPGLAEKNSPTGDSAERDHGQPRLAMLLHRVSRCDSTKAR